MNVIAVRDDGALLVTAGGEAAVIVSSGIHPTSRGAALARGGWDDPSGETVPVRLRDDVRKMLDRLASDLDAQPIAPYGVTNAATVDVGRVDWVEPPRT